ncbi:retrovirus-related pol polyprotein from transposon TNT 1-94 [Tanacetum coccineum]
MDSGASFYVTFCKEELEKFRLCSDKVHLANDKTLDIAGFRDVVLKTSFGTSWTLTDVSCGNKRGSLYMVGVPSDGINTTIDGRGNVARWHQRFGHMSEKGMEILASKGRIPDLQKAVVGFCEPCVLGKQNRVSFIKSENTRKLQRLELVHTDVYGPTSVSLIGGSRYYVTFIDDINHKVKDVARDKLDAKSIKCTFIGYGSDEMGYHFWDSKCHKVIKAEMSHLMRTLYMEPRLQQILKSLRVGSLDTSEESENNGSFEGSERSYEEDSKDKEFSEEGGSETP